MLEMSYVQTFAYNCHFSAHVPSFRKRNQVFGGFQDFLEHFTTKFAKTSIDNGQLLQVFP